MENLLTAKQVQNLLKVNRITVYRMLKDGRIKGVKIGQQWRFPTSQFDNLDSLIIHSTDSLGGESGEQFPVHCIQAIQNLYVELAQVGAITVDRKGQPITEVGRPCDFCHLLLSNTSGKAACEHTWSRMAATNGADWHVCHAGLYYRKTPIHEENGKTVAYFYSGQFHLSSEGENDTTEHIRQLARLHQINETLLLNAYHAVRTWDLRDNPIISAWPQRFTQVIEAILMERNRLVERLHRIVEIGTL